VVICLLASLSALGGLDADGRESPGIVPSGPGWEPSDASGVVVTLHTATGREHISCLVKGGAVAALGMRASEDAVWGLLPTEQRDILRQRVAAERDQVVRRMVPAAGYGSELWGDYNLTFNFLCSVVGVGILLLLPPFLPLSLFLFATFLLFATNGTMGSWTYFVTFAFMAPFVGISFYAPNGAYAFVGYAGIAVGAKS